LETNAWPAAAPRAKTPIFKAIGPVDSNVLSMSSDGTIAVGDFIFGGGAFRWVRGQGTMLLGDAGGQISVSRDGAAIVGDVPHHGHLTAAIWRGGTTWKSLGGYAESQGCPDLSNAYAVSDGGKTVVGLGWGGCKASAFRWTKKTGMVTLGSLDGQASRANDISADGSVIVAALGVTDDGRVIVGFSGGRHRDAFVWTSAMGMVRFEDYLKGLGVTGLRGWRLDTATAISGDGTTIAGWGYRPDGHVQSWIVKNLPPFPGTPAA
jgi:uncharacterized membrane protein